MQTNIFESLKEFLEKQSFRVVGSDFTRPWGGFFVIDESQAEKFIETFFPGHTQDSLMIGEKLSPKLLAVAPGQRLSWQYHHRRAEIWRVVDGPVLVAISKDDTESDPKEYEKGETITLNCGDRHRLIGSPERWGVVAEIWQHTEPGNPSDEEDIVRVQDDFGR